MIEAFSYQGLPVRVVFGAGTLAQVADEAARLGIGRALVISTPNQRGEAERVRDLLGSRAAAVFDNATMHTPVEVTARAMEIVREQRIDGTIAIGGGSTTGLGKAIAVRTDLPQVVIPTTYAGSEMTPILGETEAGVKTTRRDMKILPETVIYDVDLTLTLPPGLTVTSGFNAIAHAVEALYAKDRNPIVSVMSEECIREIAAALPLITANPADRTARASALYGAWLGGAALGSVGMALHHKLCHVVGGSFDLPHAETHTVILPHAVAYNEPAVPDAMRRVARCIGAEHAATGLHDLALRVGAPTSLRSLGMREEDIDRAADLAVANPYWNPRPLDRDAIRTLLAAAWSGQRPV